MGCFAPETSHQFEKRYKYPQKKFGISRRTGVPPVRLGSLGLFAGSVLRSNVGWVEERNPTKLTRFVGFRSSTQPTTLSLHPTPHTPVIAQCPINSLTCF
ncbi:MAG: hypothetical protein F6J93_26970 [Oscillatoria sp. SIO1A7]|nr:hypothetical protein [Oscillatoria sp. SIO1A7]